MTAGELKEALIEYGADEAGIKDRFGDNAELYEMCFKEFLDGAYVPALADAVRKKDYVAAFEAAHAIKGLSGNLGLKAYFEAICALVESLRAERYAHIEEEYAETERQFGILRRIYTGEKVMPDEPEITAPRQTGDAPAARKKIAWFAPVAAGIALFAVLLVFFMFRSIVNGYERNVTTESAGHLIEINYQLKEYIEDQVESDWLIAYTIKSYISRSLGVGSDGDYGVCVACSVCADLYKRSSEETNEQSPARQRAHV